MQNPTVLASPSAEPKLTLLTPEIRNQIFDYVLVPGAVYIHVPPDNDLIIKATSPTLPTPSNRFSLLAVIRGIHQDYATRFYRQNTFYLPGGPVADASSYYTYLKPEHQRLIQYVGIRLSLADLTPNELDRVLRPGSWARNRRLYGKQLGFTTWKWSCLMALRIIWVNKLIWIRDIHVLSRNTGAVRLRSVQTEGALCGPFVLSREELEFQLKGVDKDVHKSLGTIGKELEEVITTEQEHAKGLMEANVAKNGEKETIAWMKKLPA